MGEEGREEEEKQGKGGEVPQFTFLAMPLCMLSAIIGQAWNDNSYYTVWTSEQ